MPGWDCHGLPIEWKIEEKYRAEGKSKDDVPIDQLRRDCRAFANHWIDVQREQFKRLGCIGEWDNPYTTMDYRAEAIIAGELHKFVGNGLLYRGFRPVMWSPIEKTALAEAEVEYREKQSPTIYVKFPRRRKAPDALKGVQHRHLDDDAVDDPRQSRHRVLADDGLRPVRSRRSGARARSRMSARRSLLADALAEQTAKHAKARSEACCRPSIRAD